MFSREAMSATTACDPSPPAIAIASAPRASCRSTVDSRLISMDISTGSMPRLRASSARWNRVALPPPDRGLKISTGRDGRSTGGSWTRLTSASRAHETAPAAQTRTSTVARGSRLSSSATATTTRATAVATRTRRAAPRRRRPCQAPATARPTRSSTHSPRGKSATAAITAITAPAGPRSSAGGRQRPPRPARRGRRPRCDRDCVRVGHGRRHGFKRGWATVR